MLASIAPVAPPLGPRRVEKLTLEQRGNGPVWVIHYQGGDLRRADPATGAFLPKVSAPEAAMLAASYYLGKSKQVAVRQFANDEAPLDLRKNRPSWQVSYADGTRIYVDAANPAKSVTDPPPSATMVSRRSKRRSCKCSHTRKSHSVVLQVSPSGTSRVVT